MRKLFLAISCICIIGCTEDSFKSEEELAALSRSYEIPVDVLKSSEFKDYMEVSKEVMIAYIESLQEYSIAVESKRSEGVISDINNEIQSLKAVENGSLDSKAVNQTTERFVGKPLMDLSGRQKVDEKKKSLFKKFPQYENDKEFGKRLHQYFRTEFFDVDKYLDQKTEQTKAILNKKHNQ